MLTSWDTEGLGTSSSCLCQVAFTSGFALSPSQGCPLGRHAQHSKLSTKELSCPPPTLGVDTGQCCCSGEATQNCLGHMTWGEFRWFSGDPDRPGTCRTTQVPHEHLLGTVVCQAPGILRQRVCGNCSAWLWWLTIVEM
jgi:hypothetical protein